MREAGYPTIVYDFNVESHYLLKEANPNLDDAWNGANYWWWQEDEYFKRIHPTYEPILKEYLEILLKFSSELDSVESISDDMFDQYILQLDETRVKNQDLSLRKKILINKHIEDTFMPYILYMQIMLLNS